jgi:hypothetical protein
MRNRAGDFVSRVAFFCAPSDSNKSSCSEEIANKIVSQLQPPGCSKKRFDGANHSFFRRLDVKIGPEGTGRTRACSKQPRFRDLSQPGRVAPAKTGHKNAPSRLAVNFSRVTSHELRVTNFQSAGSAAETRLSAATPSRARRFSRLARMNAAKSGCGASGFDLNSG